MKAPKAPKILAFVLAMLVTLSAFPMSAMAANDTTVYMTVSVQGELAETKDGKPVAYLPVTVEKGSPTADDAIKALHDQYYRGGSSDGYSTSASGYGGMSMVKVWGETDGVGAFYINGSMPWDTVDTAQISNGDKIDVIVYRSDWSDTYAAFDKTAVSALPGEVFDLNLYIDVYDENYNISKAPLASASIWTGTDTLTDTGLITDDDGKISLSFSLPGTYIVTAKTENAITAPACIVTIRSFDDVSNHWAKKSVEYVVTQGYFKGVSDTRFSPDTAMNRAMLVTVLWRLAGRPTADTSANFSDVAADQYYTDAVNWAAENGIVTGYANGKFGINDNITREQMAAMLFRYTQWDNGSDIESPTLNLKNFSDSNKISSYAKGPMAWAYIMGLINGRTETTLVPGGSATRAEVATIIKRYDDINFSGDEIALAAKSTAAWLYVNSPVPQLGDVGGWTVTGLKRSGFSVPQAWYDSYLAAAKEALVSSNGVLSERKYTEYSRTIMGLTSIGIDASNFEGYDLTAPLADFDATVYQGINGAIFALLALDSGDYSIPTANTGVTNATREMYVKHILSKQMSDGGFALTGDRGDADVTAMALRALASYTDMEGVSAAINKALSCLSLMQNDGGGFSSWGSENSQSCAQVIMALTALGIDVDDSRFVKNGNSPLDALLSYRLSDGSFSNTKNGKGSVLSTEQALLALTGLEN